MDYYEECIDIIGDVDVDSPEFEKRLDLVEEYLYAKFLAKEIIRRENIEEAREVARERAKFERSHMDEIGKPYLLFD